MSKMVRTEPIATPVQQRETLSDELLLLRYRDQQDRAAFAILVKRYEQPLFNYLCRYFNDSTLADDIFQMSFLQVHLKCASFDGSRPFRPWLYTIAANQAINLQRARKRKPAISLNSRISGSESSQLSQMISGKDADPAELVEAEEEFAELRKLVAELPPNTRNALLLVYFQGMKYSEAADELNVPLGTVKRRVHSAIGRLHDQMQRARAKRPR